MADGYVLETETIEEMNDIIFPSPSNLVMEREVCPLGTFKGQPRKNEGPEG